MTNNKIQNLGTKEERFALMASITANMNATTPEYVMGDELAQKVLATLKNNFDYAVILD